jgi:c-di-GMP-binding flagellar brake protein YcgR
LVTTLWREFTCHAEGTRVSESEERRKFPRIKAPVYCRPARRRLPRRQVIDLGLGGMRVYSDDAFKVGARFDVELFLPDSSSITCLTEVVWIRRLEGGAPASFDVGLQFLDVPADDHDRLRDALADNEA